MRNVGLRPVKRPPDCRMQHKDKLDGRQHKQRIIITQRGPTAAPQHFPLAGRRLRSASGVEKGVVVGAGGGQAACF